MKVTGTEAAERVVARARQDRSGALVFTIGTGCCESTAPFLYEDFWPGPDQERVGDVGGVPVYAPQYLRALYPDGDGVVIDVEEIMAESLSIETEYGCRFTLREPGGEKLAGQEQEICTDTTAARPDGAGARSRSIVDVPDQMSALRTRGPQELPEALRRARMR